MKGTLVALDRIAGRKAAAMLVDGVLEDLLIDPPEGAAPPVGAIWRAICDRPVKGQGGMFVRLAGSSGFLRGAKGLRPGQPLLVQVTGRAEPGKAVPVTSRVLFKSRYAIVTPGAPGVNISRAIHDEALRVQLREIAQGLMAPGEGLILRSAAALADAEAVTDDIVAMRDLARAVIGDAAGDAPELMVDGPDAHALAWREWPSPEVLDDAPGAFDRQDVHHKISTVVGSEQRLPGGFLAFIEQTRAFVAVDVNTGADTSPAAGLKANLAAAKVLPRALRCRGYGGQVVIDFAPMPKKNRRQVESTLRAAFRADPIETALVGWTPLGHFELQRKRERVPLSESLP